ncbi:LytTR family DNA-binding domain-containing protein [Phenylobacterium sp.]|uniref:LytTR family DNA-binding domain-containing protein n=1 Tax=Phenylobacterium sp. TaxID=1871053 RepID=UPI00281182A2|nr:LytTR family DNA-binding domain-containing protein [Phenylobacterium sp.]
MGGRRRDAVFVLAVVAIGSAIAIVDAFTVVHDVRELGRPLPLWEPLVWEFTSVAVLVALTPAVQALTRRAMPLRAPWRLVVPAHLAAALVFSLIHVIGMGLLRWAVYAAVGETYAPFGPLREFLYEFRKDLLVYAAFVAIYTLWTRLTSDPPRVRDAASVLEVRDGARRVFVPLSEVLYVEAAGNYVELHRTREAILHRASLGDLARELASAGFVRIHRSRLVRRDAVARVDSKPSGDFTVRLTDGRELAGSRRFRWPLLEP